jgi:predicted ATP-dependent endonuclease of OLD family
MRILRFRIKDYKCIEDSGWVDVGSVTALVGKNESGKTAALEALQKFNSNPPVLFAVKDFPRPKQKTYNADTDCVEVKVEPTKEERNSLAEILPELKQGPSKFIVRKNYSNLFSVDLGLPDSYRPPRLEDYLPELEDEMRKDWKPEESAFHKDIAKSVDSFLRGLSAKPPQGNNPGAGLTDSFNQFRAELKAKPDYSQPANKSQVDIFLKRIESKVHEIAVRIDVIDRAEDLLLEFLPPFIYFDEYEIIRGTVDIAKFADARKAGQLQGEFKTMNNLVSMAGLNVEELIAMGQAGDIGSREILCQAASTEITGLSTRFWQQKAYEVEFRVDANILRTLIVERPSGKQTFFVPLEDRSKGFKWQFSFNVNFSAATKGELKGTILLLDEPGLHLHPAAQADLLKLVDSLAQNNQIVYTTHSPFMIDGRKLDRVRVCRETYLGAGDNQISEKYWAGDEESVFPLLAALGYDLAQSLLIGKNNLILEGITDYWYLTGISNRLSELNREGLRPDITPCPVGGASRVYSVAAFISGQKLNVVALLDSEAQGKRVRDDLVKTRILKKDQLLLISDPFGDNRERDMEDLFPEDFYLSLVQDSYAQELAGKGIQVIQLPAQRPPRIVKAIEEFFAARNLPAYQKTRPASLLIRTWPDRQERIPEQLLANFETLLRAINKLFER